MVFAVAVGLDGPRFVGLDERNIEPFDAGDAMHLAEVGLQVDLIQAHLAFLDVAGLEADDRLLVGAEHPLGGQRERLLGQPGHGGGGIRVGALGGELLIELERFLELAELVFQKRAAFQHGGAGFGAFRVFAHQLRPFLNGFAIAAGDGFLRALGCRGFEGFGFVDGPEKKEDARRAFVQRMGAEEGIEALRGEFRLVAGEGIKAQLKLGVDDGILAVRPLGAVRIILDITLPGGDRVLVLFLLVLNLPDPIERAHSQIRQMGGGRGAEFFVDGRGGIARGELEPLGGDEIAVGGDGVIGAAGGLQGLGDHPRGPHGAAADRMGR